MSVAPSTTLEQLLRNNDLGWMIDMYAPPQRAIPHLMEQLNSVQVEYRARIGTAVSFTPEALAAEAESNSHRVRAFLQALSSSHSSEMLVMVWRILQGLRIREVLMRYDEQDSFSLDVTLARPGEEEDGLETYRSVDINDATLLRHFGITKVDGRPLFDGFFPMRKK